MGKSRIRESIGENIFNVFNMVLLFAVSVIVVYPFWNVLIVSFSDYATYAGKTVVLWPQKITFAAYKYIFATNQVPNAITITVFITVVGTALNMAMTLATAYALSKRYLPGRNFIFTIIIITMFFQGGLIPYFLQLSALGLRDSVWVMIFPLAISTWNMIIVKNYFQTIPAEIEDSAKIDGANDILILVRIVLPISMPVIATFTLFYGVARWNEWYHALLFINTPKLFPLQRVLREIVITKSVNTNAQTAMDLSGDMAATSEGTRAAIIAVALLPIAVVYPFLQKHFAKGVMVGAVKG